MFGFGKSTVTRNKAEVAGVKTQAYINSRTAKIAAFIPKVYDRVCEKIDAFTTNNSQPEMKVDIVKLIEKEGENMFDNVFALKEKNVHSISNEEYSNIQHSVRDRLKDDGFNVEIHSTSPKLETIKAFELCIHWSLPPVAAPVPVVVPVVPAVVPTVPVVPAAAPADVPVPIGTA
jgi:hypothetical protein